LGPLDYLKPSLKIVISGHLINRMNGQFEEIKVKLTFINKLCPASPSSLGEGAQEKQDIRGEYPAQQNLKLDRSEYYIYGELIFRQQYIIGK